jgi:hypothetical protein
VVLVCSEISGVRSEYYVKEIDKVEDHILEA